VGAIAESLAPTTSDERHHQPLLCIRGYCRQRTTGELYGEIAAVTTGIKLTRRLARAYRTSALRAGSGRLFYVGGPHQTQRLGIAHHRKLRIL
jgi:hypothetical protein